MLEQEFGSNINCSHVLHIQPILWNSIGDISNSFGYSVQTVAIQNTLCVDSCGRVRLWHRSSRVLRRCLAAWNFDKHLVNSDCCWGFVVYAQIGGKYSHLAHILASLTLCLALPCMKWTCLVLGPVRFAEKTNRNTVPVDLLWEKNTVPTEKQAKKYGL